MAIIRERSRPGVHARSEYESLGRGGGLCLSILNIIFAILFGLLVLFLGSSLFDIGEQLLYTSILWHCLNQGLKVRMGSSLLSSNEEDEP
ncbi:hypothetical protein Ahy_A02g006458 [Arachis hypogaea]|uniref:Uncharacterized protein n=1 Tax=Arachis hypogaea TaxID=3818 RepID=A0A445E9R6_ARAHY|nr:hypothetical protein Ahy_A02g006458 [Arachis hypogaea]